MAFIDAGSIQLLVGPASALSTEQMKVRSSTRATSVGSEAAWKELGLAVSRVKVPASTSASVSRVHSSSDPSAKTTRSGWASSATSSTQDSSAGEVPCGAPRWARRWTLHLSGSATAGRTGPSERLVVDVVAGGRMTAVTCTISWRLFGSWRAGRARQAGNDRHSRCASSIPGTLTRKGHPERGNSVSPTPQNRKRSSCWNCGARPLLFDLVDCRSELREACHYCGFRLDGSDLPAPAPVQFGAVTVWIHRRPSQRWTYRQPCHELPRTDSVVRHSCVRARTAPRRADRVASQHVPTVRIARRGRPGDRHLLAAGRAGQPARAEPPGTGRCRHRGLRRRRAAGHRQAADRGLGGRRVRRGGPGGAQPHLRRARAVRQHRCAHGRQHPSVRPGRPAVRAQRRVRRSGPARRAAGRARAPRTWSPARPTASGCSR